MIRYIISVLLALSFLNADPVSVDKAFQVNLAASKDGVNFNFDIDQSVYLYADQLKFEFNDKDITQFLTLPKTSKHNTSTIFDGKFDIFVPSGLILSSTGDLNSYNIKLKFIGCALDGFCYNPQIYSYNVSKIGKDYDIKFFDISNLESNKNSDNSVLNNEISQQDSISKSMSEKSFIITLITFFGYGLLLAFTPCVFPMIPILSSIIVAKCDKEQNSKHGFIISLIYVIAMAFAYALIGAFASVLGASLSSALQIPWVIVVFALIFVALAFSMFGFYQLQIPASIQNKISSKSNNSSGLIGVFIMGFLSALIVGPCVAAPLAGALLYIADTGNVLLGSLSLFVMGFAMGVPLLLIGFGSGKFMPRPGFWMDEISKIFGFIMLFMAVWMLGRILSANTTLLLYGIIGVFFGAFMLPNESHKGGIKQFKLGFSVLAFIYSVILIIGFASGGNSYLKPLQILDNISASTQKSNVLEWKKVTNLNELESIIKASNKPVMIDFWATWCVICKELDKTLSLPSVQSELANFTLVKVDVTKNSSDDKDMMAKFGVYGPPALVFFKDNVEIKNEKSVGFLDEIKMLEKLRKF